MPETPFNDTEDSELQEDDNTDRGNILSNIIRQHVNTFCKKLRNQEVNPAILNKTEKAGEQFSGLFSHPQSNTTMLVSILKSISYRLESVENFLGLVLCNSRQI